MAEYTFIDLEEYDDNLLSYFTETDIDFFEYKEISFEQRKFYLRNKLSTIIKNKDNIVFLVNYKNKVISIWIVTKNVFDSQIFKIPIYKIEYLIVNKLKIENLYEIIETGKRFLKDKLSEFCREAYFQIGLNTNSTTMPKIFNALSSSGFHYIHTLITYGMRKKDYNSLLLPNDSGIVIRKVNKSDVESIKELAVKSFIYSRFHLDPFLDKTKANILLRTSAENSILKDFVDVMFVADIDGKVVGYYSAKKMFIHEYNLHFGNAVISAVNENYRGRGIFKE